MGTPVSRVKIIGTEHFTRQLALYITLCTESAYFPQTENGLRIPPVQWKYHRSLEHRGKTFFILPSPGGLSQPKHSFGRSVWQGHREPKPTTISKSSKSRLATADNEQPCIPVIMNGLERIYCRKSSSVKVLLIVVANHQQAAPLRRWNASTL